MLKHSLNAIISMMLVVLALDLLYLAEDGWIEPVRLIYEVEIIALWLLVGLGVFGVVGNLYGLKKRAENGISRSPPS